MLLLRRPGSLQMVQRAGERRRTSQRSMWPRRQGLLVFPACPVEALATGRRNPHLHAGDGTAQSQEQLLLSVEVAGAQAKLVRRPCVNGF